MLLVGDAAHPISVFHDRLLRTNDGTGPGVKARPHVQLHGVGLRDLDGARVHHAGTGAGELEHFRIGDPSQEPGRWHEAGIGRVDAAHVGEDLAGLRLQGGGQRHGGGVGSTPPKRGHVHLRPHPLEAGHHDDPSVGELALDPRRRQADDARPGVPPVGLDAGLEAEQRHSRDAQLVQRHRHEGGRDALTGGEQLVQLAGGGIFRHPGGQAEQPVGRVAHRADHDDDVVSRPLAGGHPPSRPLDPSRGTQGAAAELLDEDWPGHGLRQRRQ